MWTYDQKTGDMSNGEIRSKGYSGHPPHTNDPAAQKLHCVGPIPQGFYNMAQLIEGQTTHGPYVIRLEPATGNAMFERSGFLIHGDSIAAPGTASNGCIIMSRPMREIIWKSNDHLLEVI